MIKVQLHDGIAKIKLVRIFENAIVFPRSSPIGSLLLDIMDQWFNETCKASSNAVISLVVEHVMSASCVARTLKSAVHVCVCT